MTRHERNIQCLENALEYLCFEEMGARFEYLRYENESFAYEQAIAYYNKITYMFRSIKDELNGKI